MMIGIAVVFVLVLVSIIVGVDAHGYMTSPRSRNFVAYKEGAYYGGNQSTPAKEYCPHCLNKGGTLGQCGVVENRNYDTPKNALGGALVPNIQATYTRGSQIDIEIVLTAIHKGHFLINACPISAGGIATGDCFQSNPLEFVQDLLYGASKDPNYPYRAYVAPSGYSKLVSSNSEASGTLYRYRFKLPSNVVGDRVLLQWHYLTGNTCVFPGYSQYRWPSDWPASNTGAGLCPSIPADGNGTPEQFWNCADVRIVDGVVSNSAPVSSRRNPPTPRPNAAPTQKSPVATSSTGGSSVRTCGNGNIGNGKCPSSKSCCSKWGWCGTSSSYCGNKATRTLQSYCGNGNVGNGVCQTPGYCCSKFGFCGSGTVYCGAPATGGTCGNGNRGNGKCTNTNYCCSRFGFCGSDTAFCANSTSTVGTCGSGIVGNGICSNPSLCCSKAGYCGTGSSYCGTIGTCGGGSIGNGICVDSKLCCSKAGYCGNSTSYCGNKAPVPTANRPSPRPISRPVQRPTLRPVRPPTPRPTSRPIARPTVPRPVARPTQRPTSRPVRVARTEFGGRSRTVGTCGGGNTGNGVCIDASLCCSKWGYCGSTGQYCHNKASKAAALVTATATAPVAAPVSTSTSFVSVTAPNPIPGPATTGTANCGSSSMNVNFGYYQSWAIWRQQGCNKVLPNTINVAGNGYTHLAYAFAGININDHLAPWGDDYQGEPPQYALFNSLKSSHPSLKTSIAVGGWTFNDPGATQTRFSDIASSESRRAKFAASVISFLDTYGFDGIDFDWEYPGDTTRGGRDVDIQNFPLLLKAVRDAAFSAGKTIIISVAVPTSPTRLNTGYNLSRLSQHVDFFNLMAYDIHGSWDSPQLIGAHTDLTYIKQSVQYFFQHGVPSSKMLLGLAAYGHTYYLSDPSCTTPGCGFTAGGPGGCAGATGNMPYFTIDQYVQSKNYKSKQFNANTGSMELVIDGNVWISYDNPKTLGLKASFAASVCLRGTMWWAVDLLSSPIVLG